MPVGPSHGGGGFSSGGGSSHSSGGSFGHSIGGAIITAAVINNMSPKQRVKTGFIVGIIFAVFFALFGVLMVIGGISEIGKMSLMAQDAKEYQEIIQKANDGESGYYKLTITNIHKNSSSSNYDVFYLSGDHSFDCKAKYYTTSNDIDYYYLDYSFNDGVHGKISAQTYACQSQSAVQGLSELTLAYTREYDADGSWDVIPTNYTLESNMEYNPNQAGTIIIGVLFVVIATGVIVGLSIGMKKKLAAMSIDRKNDGESFSGSGAQGSKVANEEKTKTCMYCGSVVDKSVSNCPSCGSTKFK